MRPMDLLDVERISRWLDPGHEIEVLQEVGSTNTLLAERAAERSVHRHLVTAEAQTAGRGRRGRHWVSPFGRNLAMTVGWESSLPGYRLSGLSLGVGLSIHSALTSVGARSLALKWPNDVLAAGRKLCGVLVEVVSTDPTTVLVGVGVNVDLSAADRAQIEQPSADLRELGVTEIRSDLVGRLALALFQGLERFEVDGFGPLAAEYVKYMAYMGEDCRVLLGDDEVFGRVVGVTQDGLLRLECAEGERTFSGGEVSLRRFSQA